MDSDSLFINADKYASDDEVLRIKALKYRIDKYVDVLMRENEIELLNEWVSHYIDDQTTKKVMRANESLINMTDFGFREVQFVYKSDIEMLAILQAKK